MAAMLSGSDMAANNLKNQCFKPTTLERWDFIHSSAKNSPDMVICYRCYKLHNPFLSEARATMGYAVSSCDHRYGKYMGKHMELPIHWAQIAIKRFQLGLDIKHPLQQLALAHSYEARTYEDNAQSEARIVRLDTPRGLEHRLYLQLKSKQQLLFLDQKNIQQKLWAIVRSVRCHKDEDESDEPRLKTLVSQLLTKHRSQSVSSSKRNTPVAASTTCPSCATECEIKIEKKELTITIWQDFGDCHDPLQPLWKSHSLVITDYHGLSFLVRLTRHGNFTPEKLGTLKARFEGA